MLSTHSGSTSLRSAAVRAERKNDTEGGRDKGREGGRERELNSLTEQKRTRERERREKKGINVPMVYTFCVTGPFLFLPIYPTFIFISILLLSHTL